MALVITADKITKTTTTTKTTKTDNKEGGDK